MGYNFAHGEYVSKPKVRYLHDAGRFPACYQSRMKTNIKEFRLRKRMTQDTLAELVGMSKSYLSEIERGVKEVNGRRLEAFAKALGVQTRDLIVGANDYTAESASIAAHIEILKSLKSEDQEAILRMARALSQQNT